MSYEHKKLHEMSMISDFSYMEIVWLEVFHKLKKIDFVQNFWVVFVTKHKWQRPWFAQY